MPTKKSLHEELPEAGNRFRARMLKEVEHLIGRERRKADRQRSRFFKPGLGSIDRYEESTREYRRQFSEMLGWPLAGCSEAGLPSAEVRAVADDSLGRISRVWIEALPGVHTYGLYFRPRGRGPFPLVISQHGGGGTPELCSGFFGSANYNDMTRRVLRRGMAVFAPQLLRWGAPTFGPKHDTAAIDRQLKQLGGSVAALELHRLVRCIDYFSGCREIDPGRVGMIGLSYGGFYTLFAAALDPRIRVAVSSCFFNNRLRYDFADWSWFNAANRFLDAEVGALVCPRPLYVEVGKKDTLFDVRYARPVARQLAAIYRRLGIAECFRYREHGGGHELDRGDGGIDFLCRHLR